MLCEDCIDKLDYIECDCRKELWLADAIKFYYLNDDRIFCEYCAEDQLEENYITEDDIDFIENNTGFED